MLSITSIHNIRAFLERVQLSGKEVPAFNQVLLDLAAEESALRRQGQQAAAERAIPVGAPPQPSSAE